MKNVLVIEDDRYLLNFYEYLWEKMKSSVKLNIVESGILGLEKLADQSFDLVLLDLKMSEMDGFEVLQRMVERGHLKENKVVVVSNLDSEEDREKALALGASDYYVKADLSNTSLQALIEGRPMEKNPDVN